MIKNKTILITSNDSGGGNILLPIIDKLKKNNTLILYPTGPTRNLWDNFIHLYIQKKQINFNLIDLIITGTSHFSNTERNIWAHSQKKKIKSIAVIDNWLNIEERFKHSSRNLNIFPKEIFVLSENCKKTISKLNTDAKIRIIENPLISYFSKQKKNNSIK